MSSLQRRAYEEGWVGQLEKLAQQWSWPGALMGGLGGAALAAPVAGLAMGGLPVSQRALAALGLVGAGVGAGGLLAPHSNWGIPTPDELAAAQAGDPPPDSVSEGQREQYAEYSRLMQKLKAQGGPPV